ncbi:DUF1127 domain-containing protein [Ruegeria sp. 2205SS24-7]|uniref:DUF1127 domain-containing protein n=1 Tax=Ruegeria discodermiae TaxID=3064389 RepID=UPI0027408955|nr:DUF1127 domain-containing protein [Ruegeria sp. 2205SS24-7]MDP5217934.1 DUF1127 domain-containing protein [Ruegeria sp. 2205SS24-7]
MTLITERHIRPSKRRSFWCALTHAWGVRRNRRRLLQLDDAALKDIGITRSEALAEARRSFWDAPETWRS